MIAAQENHYTNRRWQEIEDRFSCSHERVQLVKYQQSNMAWRIRRQCLHCGEYTTSDLPQRNVSLVGLPVFNAALRESYRQAKRKAYEDERLTYLSEIERGQLEKDRQWWANYNRYLETPHWNQLRCAVLRRDNYQCQNCFCKVTETSAHIHHTSYTGFERVGKSFAFECITLCRKCHIDYHPRMQQ